MSIPKSAIGNLKENKEIYRVLKKLIEQDVGEEKRIYFSGEYDSNQTEFECLSNNLHIGMIASCEKSARAGLRIVRYLVDNHHKLFEWDKEDADENNIDIIDYMAAAESNYGQDFALDETFTVKLGCGDNTTIIKKTLNRVKYVWTLEKIAQLLDIEYF